MGQKLDSSLDGESMRRTKKVFAFCELHKRLSGHSQGMLLATVVRGGSGTSDGNTSTTGGGGGYTPASFPVCCGHVHGLQLAARLANVLCGF